MSLYSSGLYEAGPRYRRPFSVFCSVRSEAVTWP